MKKVLIGVAVVLALLLVALISIPFLFKDKIIALIKDTANEQLNATLDFKDVDISVFKSFPELYLTLNELKITGKDTFANIELVNIKEFGVGVDLLSVIGDQIKVREIDLQTPRFHVLILKDGRANYDIAKADSTATTEEPEDASSGGFKLNLKRYSISNGDLYYNDETLGFITKISGLSHEGKGDFTQDIVALQTMSKTDSLYVSYEGVPYLNYVHLNAKCDLELDMLKSLYAFKQNEFLLNDLPITFDGVFGLPNDIDITMDLKFEAKKSDFKHVLSLIPAVYAKDFAGLKASGKFALKGAVKGTYNDKVMPGFDMALLVENGMFQYPNLPAAVNDIQVDLKVHNVDGVDDHTVIDLKKMHINMAGQVLDARILTKTPVSDPHIDGEIKGKVDLGNMSKIMPLTDGETYAGTIDADVVLKGNMSAVEQGHYDQFKASGFVNMSNIVYATKDMPKTSISTGNFKFSPQFLEISSLQMTVGKSDFALQGKASNYLAYYLKDEPLEANFVHTSNLIDANEFMSEDAAATPAATTDSAAAAPMSVIEIPANIKFSFISTINTILYGDKKLEQAKGIVKIADRVLTFEELSASLIGGRLSMSGSYDTKNPQKPMVDFNMNIDKFDLPLTFKTFVTIQKLAPIIENSQGAYSANIKFTTPLNGQMEPDLNALNGSGKLLTHQVVIENSGALGKVADQFKMDQFKRLNLNNVNISFTIKDGKIDLVPFDFMVGKTAVNVSGYSKVDQTLDFKMAVTVPTEDMKGMNTLTSMMGAFAGVAPKAVKADVLIKGTAMDPKVSVSFKDFVAGTVDNVKDKAKEELNKFKTEAEAKAKEELAKKEKEAREKAKAEADKLIKDAEAKSAQIKAEAQKAAEKIRSEGETAAKKIEAEAKNPLAKVAAKEAAKKVRDEANKKADALVREANQKADGVVNTAKADAAKLNP